jgi:hypothetical protein
MNEKVSIRDYRAQRERAYGQFSRPLYTLQILLEIAEAAQSRYQVLSAEHPPGTIHDERNLMHSISEDALLCAQHMETQRLSELRFIGPFGVVPFKRGSKVRLKKGALINGTSSKIPREGITSTRVQALTLHDVDDGYVDRHSGEPRVQNARVTWAGTGGYWRWTDANNIELVGEA